MENNELEIKTLQTEIARVREVLKSVEVGFKRSVNEASQVVKANDAWYKSADFGVCRIDQEKVDIASY
jgi:hypothetical protein